jgi:hypothetical protein
MSFHTLLKNMRPHFKANYIQYQNPKQYYIIKIKGVNLLVMVA